MNVAKREIQDGRVIKSKHNLSVKYSDRLLCGISVSYRISTGAGRNWEKGSREALPTQHPPLYLFNMLKVSCNKCSLGYDSLIYPFTVGKTFCWYLVYKTFNFFSIIVG